MQSCVATGRWGVVGLLSPLGETWSASSSSSPSWHPIPSLGSAPGPPAAPAPFFPAESPVTSSRHSSHRRVVSPVLLSSRNGNRRPGTSVASGVCVYEHTVEFSTRLRGRWLLRGSAQSRQLAGRESRAHRAEAERQRDRAEVLCCGRRDQSRSVEGHERCARANAGGIRAS